MIEYQYDAIMALNEEAWDLVDRSDVGFQLTKRAMGHDHENANHKEALRQSRVALELLKEAITKTEQLIVELEKAKYLS